MTPKIETKTLSPVPCWLAAAVLLLAAPALAAPPGGGGGGGNGGGGNGGGGNGGGGGGGGPMENPAFVAEDNGSGLVLVNFDGTASEELVPNDGVRRHAPFWSPDGSRIGFLQGRPETQNCCDGDLYEVVRQADGSWSAPALLHDFGTDSYWFWYERFDWSPDGSRIVYQRGGGNDSQLYSLHLASGTIEHVVTGVAISEQPTWSPDLEAGTPGHQGFIAFAGMTSGEYGADPDLYDVYTIDVAIDGTDTLTTGAVTQLTSGAATDQQDPLVDPTATSVEQRIAWFDETYGHQVVNTVTNGLVTATWELPNPDFDQRTGTWSPNGEHLAGTDAWTGLKGKKGASDLWRMRADGSDTERTLVTGDVGGWLQDADWNPVWDANGP